MEECFPQEWELNTVIIAREISFFLWWDINLTILNVTVKFWELSLKDYDTELKIWSRLTQEKIWKIKPAYPRKKVSSTPVLYTLEMICHQPKKSLRTAAVYFPAGGKFQKNHCKRISFFKIEKRLEM